MDAREAAERERNEAKGKEKDEKRKENARHEEEDRRIPSEKEKPLVHVPEFVKGPAFAFPATTRTDAMSPHGLEEYVRQKCSVMKDSLWRFHVCKPDTVAKLGQTGFKACSDGMGGGGVYFFERPPWELGFHGFWTDKVKLETFLKQLDGGFSQSRLSEWKREGLWCLVLGITDAHMKRKSVRKIPDREGEYIPMSVIENALDPDADGNCYIKNKHDMFHILLAFEIVKGGRYDA